MLIYVSLYTYDLVLQVQLGATLCLMATAHLERTRSNYTARVMYLSEWALLDTITNILEHPLGWR